METQTVKRPRALPRVWKRFFRVERGEAFERPGPSGVLVTKTSPFTAISHLGCRCLLAPWTRVRTTTLVRDVLPGGKKGPEPAPMIPFPHVGATTGRLTDGTNVRTPAQVFSHNIVPEPSSTPQQTGPSA